MLSFIFGYYACSWPKNILDGSKMVWDHSILFDENKIDTGLKAKYNILVKSKIILDLYKNQALVKSSQFSFVLTLIGMSYESKKNAHL